MAQITAADLLVGTDEDFVINLYLACLGRWPDPPGYEHLLAKVPGRPKRGHAQPRCGLKPHGCQPLELQRGHRNWHPEGD